MKRFFNKSFLFLAFFISFGSFAFAQTDSENGIRLYDKGNYQAALEIFEKLVKENPDDAAMQMYLSLSLIKIGRLSEAEKTLGKSLALDSNQPKTRKALAYIFLIRGKLSEAVGQVQSVISLDMQDAEIYYILGSANLRLGNSEAALENAEQSIKLDNKFALSNLLKAQALINRKTDTEDNAALSDKYGAAEESVGNFIRLSNDSTDLAFWRGQQETLKFFTGYYAEKQKTVIRWEDKRNQTPLKILSKPRVAYTDKAREAGVSGKIRLLVEFAESGAVSRVLVLNTLGFGLDEETVRAAEEIKFEPEMQNGKPVSVVKIIEYSFSIH